MQEIFERFQKIGIIPVVVLERAEDAEPLAQALLEGGLPCAEITFRTDAAEDAIRSVSEHFPELLVGAGTVLTPQQAERAVDAGAKFLVSPGLNPRMVRHCRDKGICYAPGTATPSDIEAALEYGLEVVKFFPAEPLGGMRMIRALSAPYRDVRFMPTGGINAANVREYLSFSGVLACGGSWMVSSELIRERDFARITLLAREAAGIVKEIRG